MAKPYSTPGTRLRSIFDEPTPPGQPSLREILASIRRLLIDDEATDLVEEPGGSAHTAPKKRELDSPS